MNEAQFPPGSREKTGLTCRTVLFRCPVSVDAVSQEKKGGSRWGKCSESISLLIFPGDLGKERERKGEIKWRKQYMEWEEEKDFSLIKRNLSLILGKRKV